VYGRSAIGDEEQKLSPTSPYGVSKLAAESLAIAYHEWFGIPIKILRYFSVYGPGQRPDMAIARIIQALKCGTQFNVYGDGSNQRSITYIDDIVDATLLAERYVHVPAIFNICGNETFSLLETIKLLESISGLKLNMNYVDIRTGDQKVTRGTSSKALEQLGWKPQTSFKVGLEKQYFSDF
jgi:nucleoside-diphosphate-sugar epimerase